MKRLTLPTLVVDGGGDASSPLAITGAPAAAATARLIDPSLAGFPEVDAAGHQQEFRAAGSHICRLTEEATAVYRMQRRRAIIKAAVVRHPERSPKATPRFVVTNPKQSPRHLYEAITATAMTSTCANVT